MRKNISAVIEAFKARRPRKEATCSTDGKEILSYRMRIAHWEGGQVIVRDESESPSRTTTAQIRAVRFSFNLQA